jgi:hypothetical protein
MSDELLSAREAARRLGVATATLYAWLGLSDHGLFTVRGRPVTLVYYQGGPGGRGRIRIAAGEVTRLLDLMRVVPHTPPPRSPPVRRGSFPGITVPLGRPV